MLGFSIAASFVVLLVLWTETKAGFAQSNGNTRKYITWDDLTVNGQRYGLRNVGSHNRVIVVHKNGGGDSVTVQGAVDMVPQNNSNRVKIHIRPGVYSEKVQIPVSKPYISFIGDENAASATVITWHDKASDKNNKDNGTIGTWNSASIIVESDYFCAAGITFQNAVVAAIGDEGHQAVALRIASDNAMFYKCRFLGSQDTLLDQTGTHYFLQCFIQGSTDFIFGNARSLYQECEISLVGDAYCIAAQSRNSVGDNTGFSFVNCTLSGTRTIYLGRAWGDYSRVIYSYCEFDINVIPQGWSDWDVPSRDCTVVFGEYQCKGRGADRSGRAAWSKALNYLEAKPYLDTAFISGELWLRL